MSFNCSFMRKQRFGVRSTGTAKRAQVSMEFLTIIGLTFLLAVPLIVLFLKESQSAGEQVVLAQVTQIARRIADSAESVHAFGEPATLVLKVYMPPGVNSSLIDNAELVFIVNNNGNLVSVGVPTSVNLSGSISVNPGIHNIRVTAMANYVNISEFSSSG